MREREREARVGAVGVVDEQRVLADLGDVDDPQRAVRSRHDAALALRAEADRLAVLEPDLVGARLPLVAQASNAPSLKTGQFW